jgi:uncharacterized protein
MTLRSRSGLALILTVPVSSIGALMSVVIAPGPFGQSIALVCGLWWLLFPICWHVWVDKQPIPMQLKGSAKLWKAGLAIGLAMFGLIWGSYLVGRGWLDVVDIRSRVEQLQINIPLMVLGFGTFQTLINSGIEEYSWRWFVYQKCALLWGQEFGIWISALFFTLHHVVLLVAYCDNWGLVAIGTLAVFAAGVIWAKCFATYRSLLPGYLSHLAADLALQIISWQVLMG